MKSAQFFSDPLPWDKCWSFVTKAGTAAWLWQRPLPEGTMCQWLSPVSGAGSYFPGRFVRHEIRLCWKRHHQLVLLSIRQKRLLNGLWISFEFYSHGHFSLQISGINQIYKMFVSFLSAPVQYCTNTDSKLHYNCQRVFFLILYPLKTFIAPIIFTLYLLTYAQRLLCVNTHDLCSERSSNLPFHKICPRLLRSPTSCILPCVSR